MKPPPPPLVPPPPLALQCQILRIFGRFLPSKKWREREGWGWWGDGAEGTAEEAWQKQQITKPSGSMSKKSPKNNVNNGNTTAVASPDQWELFWQFYADQSERSINGTNWTSKWAIFCYFDSIFKKCYTNFVTFFLLFLYFHTSWYVICITFFHFAMPYTFVCVCTLHCVYNSWLEAIMSELVLYRQKNRTVLWLH